MTAEGPEDFAAESEVDDATRLTTRRPAPEEADDATQLASRRHAPAAPAETAEPAEPAVPAEPADVTRLARRQPLMHGHDEADSTRLSMRDAKSAAPLEATAPRTDSADTQAASVPQAAYQNAALPPGPAPAGVQFREGGFGARTEAYRPRSETSLSPLAPAVFADDVPPRESGATVAAPLEAQRRRESAHRASVGKAVAVGVVVLVLGTIAVVGVVLLVQGLL